MHRKQIRSPERPLGQYPDDAGLASVVVLIGNVLIATLTVAFMLITFGYVVVSTNAQQDALYVAQAVANANLPSDINTPDFVAGAHYTQNATPASVMTSIGQDVLEHDLGSSYQSSDTVSCAPVSSGAGVMTQASARDAVTCTVTLTSSNFEFFHVSLLSVTRSATASATISSTRQLSPTVP